MHPAWLRAVGLVCFCWFALIVPCSAAAPTTESSPRRLLTVEDMARFRIVADPRVSPDGAWVAYTVTTQDLATDRKQSDVWMAGWSGARSLRLTFTERESEGSPRWSPDGQYLAFLSSRSNDRGQAQLWRLPRAGGEAERVSDVPCEIEQYAWAPDAARIVFVCRDASRSTGAASGDGGPIVVDRLYFKEDGTGYLTSLRQHLYVLDLSTRKVEQLTRGDHDDVSPAWSPDGRTIGFLTKRGSDPDRSRAWEVHLVEARAGAEDRALTASQDVTNNPGGQDDENRIAWSPDGKWIAFLQAGRPELSYYAVNRLAVVPAEGGPVRVLTGALDAWVSRPAWAPDSKSVYVVLEEDRARSLVRVQLADGRVERLLAGKRTVRDFDVGRTGRIAALVGTATSPAEVFALDGGSPRELSRQNAALLSELRLATLEEIAFASRDGTVIHGFMLKPPDYQEGARYPTILRIHGGPVSQYRYTLDDIYDPCWQLLAASGYVVLLPNPRGSMGRGEDFAGAIRADWGNLDAQDVLAAVDDAVARGIADPGKLGIGGWSYGGILTNMVIAQDQRFKAAISGAGMSNMLAGYGTDMYIREWEVEFGTPWGSFATYVRNSSAFLRADRITTPTMFVAGDRDFDVPLLNSEQMYQALRSLGRDTKLLIYPGESHAFTRPSHLQDRMKRYLAWYDAHLK